MLHQRRILLPRRIDSSFAMQGWLLLPKLVHSSKLVRPCQVPCGLLLPDRHLRPDPVHLRPQVPGWVVSSHRLPASLLLSSGGGNQPNPVPAGLHVPDPRTVLAFAVSAWDLRVVRGQGELQHLPRRTLLPDGDEPVRALPTGLRMPGGILGQDRLPGRSFLPRGLGQRDAVPPGLLQPEYGQHLSHCLHSLRRCPGRICDVREWTPPSRRPRSHGRDRRSSGRARGCGPC